LDTWDALIGDFIIIAKQAATLSLFPSSSFFLMASIIT